MTTIKITQETLYKKDKVKGWFVNNKETETREISESEYNLLTNEDTLKYFRQLGGAETVKRNYTIAGYKIVYLSSISPDKKLKIVRKFKFN